MIKHTFAAVFYNIQGNKFKEISGKNTYADAEQAIDEELAKEAIFDLPASGYACVEKRYVRGEPDGN